MARLSKPACALSLLLAGAYAANCDPIYVQTNLVSDLSSLAPVTVDPNLKNPWGVAFSATSPFWVSNAASNTSTLYNTTNGLVLTVAVSGGPTGQVNSGATDPSIFPVGTSPARFIFDTLSGTIQGWAGGATATVEASKSNTAYTGLALDTVGSAPYLYAANFTQGLIDVYDSSWKPATLSGSFNDPSLPPGYRPYNIQNINGKLYVEYAQAGTGPMTPGRGAGLGVVDVYDANGNFIQTLIPAGRQLNAPWGITIAPAGFGAFANDLLVGNFGNGQINAFDPSTGAFIGTIDGPSGAPLANANLWALAVRTQASGFDPNAVYFTAGINGQVDGLFGRIDPAPEPGTFTMLGLALATVGVIAHRRRRTV